MTDEELGNSGVAKMLMDDVDQLEEENNRLKQYVERYHNADKDVAVLKEKAKTKIASDISFGGFLSIGSAAIGFSRSLWEFQPSGYIILSFGVILIIAGIVSKVVLR